MAQVMISYRVPETGSKSLGGDGTVDRLADALRSRGFSVFVGEQEDGLQAGEEWAKGIQNAVLSCQAMVVLCSETYGATPWTFREISLADSERKQIVAVWHSGTFPPPDVRIILGTQQRVPRGNNPITHSSVDFDTAVDELCEALRRKNVLPESSTDEADAVFKQWDRNGDGHLDSNEVLIGCLQLGMDPEEAGSLHHSFIRSLSSTHDRSSSARQTEV